MYRRPRVRENRPAPSKGSRAPNRTRREHESRTEAPRGTHQCVVGCAAERGTTAWSGGRSRSTCRVSPRCGPGCAAPADGWRRRTWGTAGTGAASPRCGAPPDCASASQTCAWRSARDGHGLGYARGVGTGKQLRLEWWWKLKHLLSCYHDRCHYQYYYNYNELSLSLMIIIIILLILILILILNY